MQKTIRISEENYDRLAIIKKKLSFDKAISLLVDYVIKSNLTIENLVPIDQSILANELLIIKNELIRSIKISKGIEKELKRKLENIHEKVEYLSIPIEEEKITSSMFLDMNNIEITTTQWLQIIELAHERCKRIEELEQIILENNISINTTSKQSNEAKNKIDYGQFDLNEELTNLIEILRFKTSKQYPVCYEITQENYDKYIPLLKGLSKEYETQIRKAVIDFLDSFIFKDDLIVINKEKTETKYKNLRSML